MQKVYSQVSQNIVHLILKKLLNYPCIVKPLGYKKRTTTIFGEVKQLVQCLQFAVTKYPTIWNSLTPIVTLDLLYDEFKMTIVPLLYSGNKNIEKIQ